MAKRITAAAFIALIALSPLVGFTARRSLPACCKAHGCTMKKTAARECAFATCDGSESGVRAARRPLVTIENELGAIQLGSSSFKSCIPPSALSEFTSLIDHPPRLLLR